MGQMNDIEIILWDMVIIHDQSGEIIGPHRWGSNY